MLKVLFQINQELNFNTDSSIVLIKEAIKRNFEVYICYPQTLSYSNKMVVASILKCSLKMSQITFSEPIIDCIDNYNIVFIRQDPPVNMSYNTLLYLLNLCKKPFFINSPSGIALSPEKIFDYHRYSDLDTIITFDYMMAKNFVLRHKKVVLKPLYEFGGRDICMVNTEVDDFQDKISHYINDNESPILIQEFDDSVMEDGDIRVLIVNGEILGAFRRNNESNFLSNTVLGAKVFKTTISEKVRKHSTDIALKLKEQGIYFAGLDFIGDNLIEINVTSPTGLAHYDKLYNVNSGAICWDNFLSLYEKYIIKRKNIVLRD